MSTRQDAFDAAAGALHWPKCNHHTGGPGECDSRAMTAVDAAIPVLLAPIRTYAERCATATYDAGSFDARRRWLDLIILLDRIEGGESR